MRAVRYYGPGDIRVDNIPEPSITDGKIKIKVWRCVHAINSKYEVAYPNRYAIARTVCGSDVHAYFIRPEASPTATTPHPITGETLPTVMGHEFSGTIVALGRGVDNKKYAVGQNVTIEPVISCMKPTCPQCTSGARNVCPNVSYVGAGGFGGGFSEYVSLSPEYVHVLPAGVSLEAGAMIEPLSVGWHAVKRSSFKPGDRALVIGCGPIGLFVLKSLQALGASWVGVSEPATERREMARKASASTVFDPLSEDVVSETVRVTDGGADVVFDCAGLQASLDTALQAVRPRGTVVGVAVWEKMPTLNTHAIQRKEIMLTSCNGSNDEHPELLQAVAAGKIKGLDELVTRKIALEDFVEMGIKALINEKNKHIKILVHPQKRLETKL
ncbi:alcohol dehydrogenase GroES domain protein [Wolfiporia cocos MD-104 SS10]|uniref:Alcohol dehydrogenase GroES domain protein n=1 Tax=Wolfiporia cocos (strain MD-104) TaxID=742152 RepID=A0A2H3J5L6_WOLCO|nr:alcohol dehydrogenase GroES domain protein [Wolfiporia cocos MD-104 SS10]